jgi:hypothetical protein
MALINDDRVMETSTSTGTGDFTLAGAITGFRAFSAVCATSDTFYYYIEAIDASGIPTGDWETGYGTYSAANTLTRTTVHKSSNANAAVSFSAGTKRVALGKTSRTSGAGSAFPSSPATGERFYRSDRNIEYFYDGTRWLSTQLLTLALDSLSSLSADGAYNRTAIPFKGTYDLWLVDVQFASFISASATWNINFQYGDVSNAFTTLATRATTGDTINQWTTASVSIAAQLSSAAYIFILQGDETSGSALLGSMCNLNYRLIG